MWQISQTTSSSFHTLRLHRSVLHSALSSENFSIRHLEIDTCLQHGQGVADSLSLFKSLEYLRLHYHHLLEQAVQTSFTLSLPLSLRCLEFNGYYDWIKESLNNLTLIVLSGKMYVDSGDDVVHIINKSLDVSRMNFS
ncbi:hypothetical protein RCL1_009006 [Eukaryota sp. TZLM3-RCL]